jgi:predicted transcriptional regulator
MATAQTQLDARFGQLLRQFRLTAELSQEALSERAAVSARSISDLGRGVKTRPHFETVRLLADALVLEPPQRAALIIAPRSVTLAAPQAPTIETNLPL